MPDDESPTWIDAGTELTAATVAQVRSLVTDAMMRGRMIDLHLESVNSYDAAGLGLLLGLKRRVEAADGRLVCVDPSARLDAGIRKLRLHRVLDIRLDLTESPSGTKQGLPSAGAGAS